MTTVNKAYATYASNRILTASPAELTLMLYEGAIKFGNIAQVAMSNQDVEKAHNNIIKIRDIILEFQSTLNRNYPVAEDFNNVYEYIKYRLTVVNLNKDPEIMEEILGHLRTLRDTWKEVMELNKIAKAN